MSRPIIGYIVEAATRLFTARRIGGVLFDGREDINLPGVNAQGNQDTTGNAASATRLQTSRNFSISGDATSPAVGFTGTANVALPLTLASITSAKTAGGAKKIPIITVDAKGRVTQLIEVDVTGAGVHDVINTSLTMTESQTLTYNIATELGSELAKYDLTKLTVDVRVQDTDEESPTHNYYINSEAVVVTGISEDRRQVVIHNARLFPVPVRIRISIGVA